MLARDFGSRSMVLWTIEVPERSIAAQVLRGVVLRGSREF
jgi:hypothetical protein